MASNHGNDPCSVQILRTMDPVPLGAATAARLLCENTTGHNLTADEHDHWLVRKTSSGRAFVSDHRETGFHVYQRNVAGLALEPADHTMGQTAVHYDV